MRAFGQARLAALTQPPGNWAGATAATCGSTPAGRTPTTFAGTSAHERRGRASISEAFAAPVRSGATGACSQRHLGHKGNSVVRVAHATKSANNPVGSRRKGRPQSPRLSSLSCRAFTTSSRSWTRNCSPFTAPLIWRIATACSSGVMSCQGLSIAHLVSLPRRSRALYTIC